MVDERPAQKINISPEVGLLQNYPQIEYAKLSVVTGTQTLTAVNKLADHLGVEFVEWTKELNPYEYHQLRSKRIKLNYEDPQAAFLELFDRSGLLPVYDRKLNTVTIYPYSLSERVGAPYVFTPKFDRSKQQEETFRRERDAKLVKSKKLTEYHFYKEFTVQETVNAWAKHANYAGVVWYLPTSIYKDFLTSHLEKSDYCVGLTPLDTINTFINEEKVRQSQPELSLSFVYEATTNRLIVHSLNTNEVVKSFDINATSLKDNIERIAKFYNYEVSYQAPNYAVKTPYTTVLTRFVKNSIDTVIQQYPVDVQVIDASKQIIVNKEN